MKTARNTLRSQTDKKSDIKIELSPEDKRFYGRFLIVAGLVTAFYLFAGGKNPFIIPAMLCIALVVRNYRNQRKRSH